jgi:hypothetical protein
LGRYETFIVRLWTDGGREPVRGHIQHIASRRGVYFRDAEKLLQFIGEHLGSAALPAASAGLDVSDATGEKLRFPPASGGESDDR